MDWKDEEKRTLHHAAEAAFIGVQEWDPAVREDCNNRNVTRGLHIVADTIASKAVELAAARGGTMTAEDLAECNRLVDMPPASKGWGDETVRDLLRHISALGARNAVLEAERDDARASAARWEKSFHDTIHALTATQTELAEARATIARLTAAGQALSEHADRTAGEPAASCTCGDGSTGPIQCPIHRRWEPIP